MIGAKVTVGDKDNKGTYVEQLMCDLCYAPIDDTDESPHQTRNSFASATLSNMLQNARVTDLCQCCYIRLREESKFYKDLYIGQMNFMITSLKQQRPKLAGPAYNQGPNVTYQLHVPAEHISFSIVIDSVGHVINGPNLKPEGEEDE
jgi:hypothetical protein